MRVWIVALAWVGVGGGCGQGDKPPKGEAKAATHEAAKVEQDSAKPDEVSGPKPPPVGSADDAKPADAYAEARFQLVEDVARAGITDDRVIAAMKLTPRHEFVPPAIRHQAYDDRPLPIGFGLTISQPFIVATMTQAARVKAGDRVLEIGTGSGYQAAVLAMMGAKVWTIEMHEELANRTKLVLGKVGFSDVQLKVGDGYFGWKDAAPFDAILITCATPEIPPPLLGQLKVGGRIVAPLEDGISQELMIITKTSSGSKREWLMSVNFGEMKGEVEKMR
jgi:protein-L-isoaspartate(D-aspartate) O-methyltransferase